MKLTNRLRWVKRFVPYDYDIYGKPLYMEQKLILQQWWINVVSDETGEQTIEKGEWRDVPIEDMEE